MSAGEIVFSSTKITPPWLRCSSAQSFSRGGIVLRSCVTRVRPCLAASSRQAESSFPRKSPPSHSAIQCTTNDRLRRLRPFATSGEMCSSRSSVEVLDFPDTASLHYAKIRASLKTRGTMIGANDLFMAAHARSLGLTLVTNNTREFGRVPKLVIENWTLAPCPAVRAGS